MNIEDEDLRKRIDHIDDQLLVLLSSRMSISDEIAKTMPIDVSKKHHQQKTIERLVRINASRYLDDQAITVIWSTIIDQSNPSTSKVS